MADLGVVHLVRRKNGQAPFVRFLESYRVNPGGIPHDLVLLYKGFANEQQLRPFAALASDLAHRTLRISDAGLDVWAYFQAARLLDCRYVCLLNSYSRVLDRDWLAKLWSHANDSDVGAVGATGSFQSFHSRYLQIMAPAQHAPLSDRALYLLRLLIAHRDPAVLRRRLRWAAARIAGLHNPVRDFPPFPNPHLRTNGIVISRDLLLQLEGGRVFTKSAAFRFESGVNSMTNQLLRRGKQVLVVGRDGTAYPPAQWPVSHTFRLGMQANLLVADNQTDAYAAADEATRRTMSSYTWGGAGYATA